MDEDGDTPEPVTDGGAPEPETADTTPPDASDAARRGGALSRLNGRRRARKARRSKVRRRVERTVMALVLLIVVVVGSVAVYVTVRLDSVGRVQVPNLTKTASGTPEDILLVGSTSRCAVTEQKHFGNFVQQCQQGVNGVNSDVVMILRLVPGQAPKILSIPRDTFVPDARYGGLSNKIDAALANGPEQLVEAIQQDFGIPINHYVVLTFQTFANIVTALGGITMYFPTSLKDAQSGLDISHSGCIHISGLEALALVRARHVQYHYDKKTKQWLGYDPTGDLGRIVRVHEFLRVLASQVAQRGLGDPLTDQGLLDAVVPNLTLDTTFGTNELLHLLLDYHHSIGEAQEFTLPVIVDAATYMYKGYNYGDVVFPAEPVDAETIATFLGKKSVPKVAPASVTVTVVDGTGSPATTAQVTSALGSQGFTVSSAGTSPSVGPVQETVIHYATAAELPAAQRVAAAFSGTAVIAKAPTVGGADISVITGTNATVVGSVATAKTTAAMTGAPTTANLLSAILTAASVPNNNGTLDPPTYATTSLPAFDPRACPKS